MKAGIASIRKELAGIYSNEEIDSLIFLIFEKVKGYSRTQFLLGREEKLTEEELLKMYQIVSRLKSHEPIQYILGDTEFFGLPFYTVPGVLIPRPETEELVQWIIQENKLAEPNVLDIGTGSGCIAVSLRNKIPGSTVLACDISRICIETTRRNAELNKTDVTVFEYDILTSALKKDLPKLDIIVSNPPYVTETEKLLMGKNVLDYEPELALFVPDEEPLIFYTRIADFAQVNLNDGGRLYFEINETFGKECMEMLRVKGFSEIELKKDIHNKDRMIRSVLFKSGFTDR
ncbi:MAG TPA: peptide chain release factor N(5)-glutamine methyltransferase [Prolixibacteraceae bacterium]|nr:peptide chain release factor N(5)-glutamine methyltransferase [Prolixibacteraceae bacterium]